VEVVRDVIVIGTSAGGVEALQGLFRGIPGDLPAAILVVLHIPSHSPSRLGEILGRVSKLPVKIGEDGEMLARGQVYVASADRHLLIEGEKIRVTRGPTENRHRPAVDTLFRSAAYSCGQRVIGIVLTGMLDDGSSGLWAIKDRGGIAIVQSPDEAAFPSMPESALAHVAIDYTFTLAEMPAALERLTMEPVPAAAPSGPSELLSIETRIALEGNGLKGGVMKLGPVSPNTCPECHGVLVRIREGQSVRYRCHTGHSFSLLSLLTDVNDEIDRTLWNVLRAIEERILLLKEMQEAATADPDALRTLEAAATATEARAEEIRAMVLSHDLFSLEPDRRPLEVS